MKIFLEDKKKQLEDLNIAINAHKQELEHIKADIESSKEIQLTAQGLLSELQSQVDIVKDQYQKEQDKLNTFSNDIRSYSDKLLEIKTQYDKESVELSKQISELKLQRENIKDDISVLYSQLQSSKIEFENTKKEYEIQLKLLEGKMQSPLQRIDELDKLISEKKTLNKQLVQESKTLENSIRQQKDILKDLENNGVSIGLLIESKTKEFKQIEKSIHDSEDKLSKINKSIEDQNNLLDQAKHSLLAVVGKEQSINEYIEGAKELYAKAGLTINL